ncbi:MAG: triose-phosphate isomerase [Planctomyces sp.]|jgi:triosephosphate isomerase|nr:triose-phosphate isomerase [Planctomyces sp.]
MRRLFVAGNWKMNTNLASGKELAKAVAAEATRLGDVIDVAVCPPFPYLASVKTELQGSKVKLGAQNVWFAAPGAFTGETAVEMLTDVGCSWVILGHSERRQILGEKDELINKKIAAATSEDLGVIFCIGELLEDRQAARTEAVLETQLAGGLANLDAAVMGQIVIAYEPVWAIGTGVTASPEQAEGAHAFIRGWLTKQYGAKVADGVRILYGGSVKADNAEILLSQPNVDGALVGGASLTAAQFGPILQAAAKCAAAG